MAGSYTSERESAQAKHKERRAAIIATTSDVMRREGVAACSVRRIARAADVSPGVIHYYFQDAQELVDLGYARLTDRFFARLEELRGTFDDPSADFWHLVAAYTEPWNAHPRMALLWSEYYTISGNNHRTAGVSENYRRTILLFEGFLRPIERGRYSGRGAAVWRHLSGAIVGRQTVPTDLEEILAEVALVVGIESPDVTAILCGTPDCLCVGGASTLY